MKRYSIFIAGLAIIGLASLSADAAPVIFTVSDSGPALNSSSPPTSTLGSVGSSIAGAPGPITYTVSGLDFSSIGGTASEQIVFSVSFSAPVGDVAYNTIPNGNIFVNSSGTQQANQIDPGEELTATLGLSSTTFSGGLSNLSIGFTSTAIGGYGVNDVVDIIYGTVPTTVNKDGTGSSTVNFSSLSSYMTYDTAGTLGIGGSGVNLQSYVVQVTAVPEPGSLALLGLGGLLMVRRRRN